MAYLAVWLLRLPPFTPLSLMLIMDNSGFAVNA